MIKKWSSFNESKDWDLDDFRLMKYEIFGSKGIIGFHFSNHHMINQEMSNKWISLYLDTKKRSDELGGTVNSEFIKLFKDSFPKSKASKKDFLPNLFLLVYTEYGGLISYFDFNFKTNGVRFYPVIIEESDIIIDLIEFKSEFGKYLNWIWYDSYKKLKSLDEYIDKFGLDVNYDEVYNLVKSLK